MKTALFVVQTYISTGGMESRHRRLAKILPQFGWKAVFALAWGRQFHDAFAFKSRHEDLETIELDGRTGSPEGRRLAVHRAIHRVKPAVVFPGILTDAFRIMMELKKQGSTVRQIVGLPGFYPALMNYYQRIRGVIDHAYGVSRLLTQQLHEVCGIAPGRISYIPTGVPEPTRPAVPRTSGPLRIGYIGRFHEEKRPFDLIELCHQLDLRRVDYKAIAVGDGPLLSRFENEAASLIERQQLRVVRAMTLEELYRDVYPALDACVLFSAHEGQPNCLMEAMKHGVVPVTSDYRGLAEQGFVRHGHTGLIFPVGDMAAAAEQLGSLAVDSQMHHRLSCSAREYVDAEHTIEGMGRKFAEMLDRCLEIPPMQDVTRSVDGSAIASLDVGFVATAREYARRLMGRRFPHRTSVEEWPDLFVEPDLADVSAISKQKKQAD